MNMSLIRKVAGLATIVSGLLVCAPSQAANPWDGKFRALAEKNDQQMTYWNVEVECNRHDECQATSSLETVFASPKFGTAKKEGPFTGSLLYNANLTAEYRRVIEEALKAPGDTSIYLQIGRPENLLECRGGQNDSAAMICLLSGKLIGGAKGKSEWLMLVPDMSTGSGCPGGSCPAVLYKK
jgi:hypothetical protein